MAVESTVEVVRHDIDPVEVTYTGAEVEYLNQETKVDETGVTSHVIEVVRRDIDPLDVEQLGKTVEVVKPGGSVVNVGVGPQLPENAYEGLVWIKI